MSLSVNTNLFFISAYTMADLHIYEGVQVHPLTLVKLLLSILIFFILLPLILYIWTHCPIYFKIAPINLAS